jgi:hypothetical protein
MTLTSKSLSVGGAMEAMSDEDLVFIAATNFSLLEVMCNIWSLEIQLEKEGKLENFDFEE